MPEVSVIMPFKDSEKTIAEASHSILDQTFKDLELIAVNDHSEDGSLEEIIEMAEKDQRLKWETNPGKGVVDALNYGIFKANAPLIARMDSDDFAFPNRIQKQFDFMRKNPGIDVTATEVVHWPSDSNRRDSGMRYYIDWVNSIHSYEDILLNRFVESPLPHPTVIFKKSLIKQYGGYRNGDFPEDYELWLRWLDQGVKMQKISKPLLKWRDRNDRLSRVDDRYSNSAFFKIKAYYLAKYLKSRNIQKVWVIGGGRKARKRARYLEDYQIEIVGYIDIVPNKTNLRKCITPEQLPPPGKIFVVNYVGVRGARKIIADIFADRGYQLGRDFLMGS